MKSRFYRSLKTKFASFFLAFAMVAGFSVSLQAKVFSGGDLDNGEKLFKGVCASCHMPNKEVLAAPGLGGVEQRWKGKEELLTLWVQNPNAALETGDAYVKSMVAKYIGNYGMMPGQAVSEQDINDIITWVVEVGSKDIPTNSGDDLAGGADDYYTWDDPTEEAISFDNNTVWFIVLGLIFLIVALTARGVGKNIKSLKHQLQNFKRAGEGKKERPELGFADSAKKWLWENKAFVSILSLFVVAYFLVGAYQAAMGVGVYEGYRPEQPIKYSHKLHAGKNKIDCQYCHHTASKSKHASIPSANICMNCHTAVKKGHNDEFTAEIQKIYDAIGFDPETGGYIEDYEEKPIEWVRVHNLPDHVYFNHKQHVVAGGLQCQNCHGAVETYTVGRIANVEEASNYEPEVLPEGKRPIIKLEKPTLTMGWCIECHGKAEIQVVDANTAYYDEIHARLKNSERGREALREYLEDDQITLKELGGWECAKCHY